MLAVCNLITKCTELAGSTVIFVTKSIKISISFSWAFVIAVRCVPHDLIDGVITMVLCG